MDDYRQFGDRPVRKNDSAMTSSYDVPWSHNNESDDSDNEELLPMGEFWPIPEDDWTVVERPHGKPRGTNGCDRGRTRIPGRKLDISGLCCDELDEIIDTEALLTYRNEATRIVDTFPEIETGKETVIVKVKPIIGKQPDGIGAVPIDITDGRDNCPVNVVVTTRGREHQNRGTKTQAGEWFPEGLKVIANEMAEGATTGELTDTCEIITKMTAMNATTKDDVIVRSAPRQVMVEVLGETRMDDNYDILDRDEMTKRKVPRNCWTCLRN